MNQPRGLAVAPDGSLYVGEAGGDRLVKLNPDGSQQWAYGTAGVWGGDANHLNTWGGGVALDGAGRVVIADTGNNRLALFNADGTFNSTFGQYGQGPYQFNCPVGLAVNPANGDVAVADLCNQRVQVYTSKYVYKATLGVTGVSGSDSAHFNNPWGVAVDASGAVYVADSENYRVQKCTLVGSGGTCSTFAGVAGVQGSDFGHFSHPFAVVVDGAGRVYVSDEWNNRVLVFDAGGAFLGYIGGSWGAFNGQWRGPEGMAVDDAGNVYVADSTNHRVQKYASGVPGWQQVNVSGFGGPGNNVHALTPFSNTLYAGTYNWSGNGAQLWRSADGTSWSPVMTNGFGITRNVGIDHLAVFSGQLYAGMWSGSVNGGEVWRSGDGLNWTRVVSQGFGDPSNGEVFQFAVFSGTLYASTWSYTSTHGAEIWRSADGVTWTRTVSNGFGTPDTPFIASMIPYDGHLYAGTYGYHWTSQPYTYTGGAVWRTDGTTWTKVSADGFGLPSNYAVAALAVFSGSLYAAVPNGSAQMSLYRCQLCDGSDWVKAADLGPGLLSYYMDMALVTDGKWLYWATAENDRGETVLRSSNGTDWERISDMGFGAWDNCCSYFNNGVTTFDNRVYIGTLNSFGAQIWKRTVTASYTSSATDIKPGSIVTFTNTSAGDYLTSTWTFGDGTPPLIQQALAITHTYAHPGAYTVTLTVDDGVDTNTLTRTNAVQVGYRAYLPAMQNNTGALIALYDDFNDPAFDGFYNPLKWQFWGPPQYFSAAQQNGVLVITNTLDTPASNELDMVLYQPPGRSLQQVQEFEARLKISSGNVNNVKMQIMSDSVNGHGWWTQCSLQAWSSSFDCDITAFSGNVFTQEYAASSAPISTDTWYTVRIEINPTTAEIRFYLNNALIGSHIPNDAAALLTATNLVPRIGTWNGVANVTGIRYIDDVQITPAW